MKRIAPPAESVSLATSDSGVHPWWEVYQPVSYNLTSRFGARAQFSAMVAEVQNCMLLSLSDLKTQSATVRAKIAAYLNDLIGLGVDGFRVDAAKHIAQADFAAIKALLNTPRPRAGRRTSRGQSPPAGSNGLVTDTSCTNGAWQCQTQSTGIKGMVGWHNATRSVTTVSDFTATAANVIGFHRGSLGWISINASGGASTATYRTGLPDGTYCDVITGGATSTGCAGASVAVSGGAASVTIPANGAVAIDVNARPGGGSSTTSPTTAPTTSPTTAPTTSPATVTATFDEYATTTTGTNVYVVGNVSALGGWDTGKAVALSSAGYPIWSARWPCPPTPRSSTST